MEVDLNNLQKHECKGDLHEAICDVCDFEIFGTRHKCLNCKNYDLCQFCETIHSVKQQHHVHHVFLKIEKPIPLEKSRQIFKTLPNLYTGEIDTEVNTKPVQNTDIIHVSIFCKGCRHPVIGTRFYCTTCPEYNLCESCESKKNHPETHCFLKIRFALPQDKVDPNIKYHGLYDQEETLSQSRDALTKSGFMSRRPKELTDSQKGRSVKVTIREMSMADLDEVYAIEQESFFTPYDIAFFREFTNRENGFLVVAEKPDHHVGGYIAYKISEKKMQIVSLAVSKNSRRMGLAQQLMLQAMEFSKVMEINKVILQVSVVNFPAQSLYLSFGFKPTKWLKGYYKDEGEDALVMVYDATENTEQRNVEERDPKVIVQGNNKIENTKQRESSDCTIL